MNERRLPAGTPSPKARRVKSGDSKPGAGKAGEGRKRGRRAEALERPVEPLVNEPVTSRTVPVSLAARTVPQRPRSARDVAQDREGRKVPPVLRFLNGLLTLLVVTLIGVGGTAYYLQAAVDAEGPLRDAKLLVIPRNDGTQQIADRLEKEGMVSDRRMFLAGLYMLRLTSLAPGGRTLNLKAGEYDIKPGSSIRGIIDTLSDGKTVLVKVTVPEGLTSSQIVERIKADPNLTGELRDVPAEGSLLPETYSLPRGSSRQTVIETMQAAQKKLVDQLWAERQEGLPFKTPAEALVMASIVEKETGRNDERDRVAAVFVDRLRKKMRLQSDPTILYGLMLGRVQWGKPILASEIQSATAHNTYVIPALPPTPICNPGRAALEATLKPAAANDLYFVADGHGGHVFAETLKDHNANVAKWRQVERERASGQTPVPATTTINAPNAKAGASTLAPQPKAPVKQ